MYSPFGLVDADDLADWGALQPLRNEEPSVAFQTGGQIRLR
jgi:hypothetical protein